MKRHPAKEIQAVIKEAQDKGWRFKPAGASAHAFGRLYCPEESRQGCIVSIWSTPRNVEKHARQLRKVIEKCPHQ